MMEMGLPRAVVARCSLAARSHVAPPRVPSARMTLSLKMLSRPRPYLKEVEEIFSKFRRSVPN